MDDVDALMSKIVKKIDIALEDCANDLYVKSLSQAPEGKDVVLKSTGTKIHSGGTLKKSAFVEARHESEEIRCFVVGYDTRRVDPVGDFNYAIVRHEKPSEHWKFLENPYKANREIYRGKIVEAINGNGNASLSGGFQYTTSTGTNTKEF